MSKEKHGILGKIIKIIMVIVFMIIGILTLFTGIYCMIRWPNDPDLPNWLNICNIVFGACLLTSPFFLSQKRTGPLVIIKWIMVVLFVIIGALYITGGAISIARGYYPTGRYYPICVTVFGCLLFTSPYFLKKQ